MLLETGASPWPATYINTFEGVENMQLRSKVSPKTTSAGGESSPGIISQRCAAARCESARLKEWEERCCQGGHPV